MTIKAARIFLPKWIRRKIPLTTKFALERMYTELRPRTAFALNPVMRRTTVQEYRKCQSFKDLYDFSSQRLGVGSVQHYSEIHSAIEYLAADAPRIVCEIGTESGGTNFLLSQGLPSVEVMIGVDLWIVNRQKLELLHRPDQKIHLINGSSYDKKTVDRVRDLLAGRKLDALFIDGDHNYDGVKQDFLRYRRMVKDGGAILFHDIIPDHLTKYGRDTGRWAGGVPAFWNQLKAFYPHQEYVNEADQDGMGIGVLSYHASVKLPEDLISDDAA